jgi:hypothetical protein
VLNVSVELVQEMLQVRLPRGNLNHVESLRVVPATCQPHRLRTEGTDHLLAAGRAVGVRKFVVQSVASASSTITSPSPMSATLEAGTAGSSSQTCRRIRARAFSTRLKAAGVISSTVRHTVGGDATGPSTSLWHRRGSMSAIASPPAVSMVATF